MTSPARGAARLLRALVLGFTCFALGLGGHLLAGGPAPSLAVAGLTSVPLGCVCLAATARRCRLGPLSAVMVGAQLALHQAFMWLAAPACVTSSSAGGHLNHFGGGHLAVQCTSVAPMGAMAGPVSGLTPLMVGAHLLAGLLAAVALAHGERLWWDLSGALGRPLVLLGWQPAPALAGRPAPAAYRGPARPVTRVASGPLSRRGPPRLVPTTA